MTDLPTFAREAFGIEIPPWQMAHLVERLALLEARLRARGRLLVEWYNAHDHHSHHVAGYFGSPDGEWHEHPPEERARLERAYRAGQARRWRQRYREILREELGRDA